MQEAQEMQVQSLGQVGPLEEEMATHSSILAWRVPWKRSLVDYSPWGCRVRHNWVHTHTETLRKKGRHGAEQQDSSRLLSLHSWSDVFQRELCYSFSLWNRLIHLTQFSLKHYLLGHSPLQSDEL